MDSALIWYGLWLLLVATVFWAAVWWWLPAIFRDRGERGGDRARKAGRGPAPDDAGGSARGESGPAG